MKALAVIVGAGFSGTLSAINIIKRLPASQNIQIILIDKSENFGKGIAYSTKDPYHFLNVRTIRMGALPENPEGFFQWLQVNEASWRVDFKDVVLIPEGFVPRRLYALYLEALFEEAKQEAKRKKINLICLINEALDASWNPSHQQIEIQLKWGQVIKAEQLILATNSSFYQNFKIDKDLPEGSYAENSWNPPSHHILSFSKLAHFRPETRVVIIGSGLTMIDAAISLIKKGYDGEIMAVSKHGQLPESQLEELKNETWTLELEKMPINLLPLFKYLINQFNQAKMKGIDWRTVMDALRPLINSLWQRFSLKEKKCFIRHGLSLWNKHRHRIPPQSLNLLKDFQQKGKMQLISGRAESIKKAENGCKVWMTNGKGIEADYVVNCAGPQMEIKKSTNPLLINLLKKEVILPNALNRGIEVDENYRVIGRQIPPLPIYALGQLLFGQKLETVAVPELRVQCSIIAERICSAFNLKLSESNGT